MNRLILIINIVIVLLFTLLLVFELFFDQNDNLLKYILIVLFISIIVSSLYEIYNQTRRK